MVLVTSEHLRTGKEYDAALLWTEDATKNSFKVCLREMQNFDGKHEDIYVVRVEHIDKAIKRFGTLKNTSHSLFIYLLSARYIAFHVYTHVADPDFELRRGPCFFLLAQPAFLPSVFFFFHLK